MLSKPYLLIQFCHFSYFSLKNRPRPFFFSTVEHFLKYKSHTILPIYIWGDDKKKKDKKIRKNKFSNDIFYGCDHRVENMQNERNGENRTVYFLSRRMKNR